MQKYQKYKKCCYCFKVGDKVWMARGVSEPVRGWAGVTPTSVGTLLQVTGDNVKVNFPECNEWQGLLVEIEATRRIICGDKVRVCTVFVNICCIFQLVHSL